MTGKRDKIITGIKSITLSDESEFGNTHFDKEGTWTYLTIELKDGNTIKFGACNCGALKEQREDGEEPWGANG